MHKRAILERLENVWQKFREISKGKATEVDFRWMTDVCEECKRSWKKHPHLLVANKKLQKFTESWDKTLQAERDGKGLGAIIPDHMFVLVAGKELSAEAEMYHRDMLPDTRLIIVRMERLTSNDFARSMHEIGHFIGFRKREKRLTHFFMPLVVDNLFRYIYECSCVAETTGLNDSSNTNGDGSTEKHYLYRFAQDKAYSEAVRQRAQLLFSCIDSLRKEMDLLQTICSGYENKINEMSEETYLSQCIKAGFFECVESPLLFVLDAALKDILASKWESIISAIDKRIPNEYQEEKTSIAESIKKAFEYVSEELSDYISKKDVEDKAAPHWFSQPQELLEEPAADVFMIKMTAMSPRKYIKLMVDSVYELLSHQSLDQSKEQLSQPTLHLRILSVVNAMNAEEKDFVGWREKLVFRLLPSSSHAYQKVSIKRMLRNMYIQFKSLASTSEGNTDLDNPTKYISDYVKEVFSDNRYNDKTKYPEQVALIKQAKQIGRFCTHPAPPRFLIR